jgi:hypothetical protein
MARDLGQPCAICVEQADHPVGGRVGHEGDCEDPPRPRVMLALVTCATIALMTWRRRGRAAAIARPLVGHAGRHHELGAWSLTADTETS